MMIKIRSILSFYKSFAFAGFTITLACMQFPYRYGIGTFSQVFWFKMLTLGMIFYLNNTYKRREFYYYKNLGVTKKLLWITTLSFDLILFLTLFFLTLNLKH